MREYKLIIIVLLLFFTSGCGIGSIKCKGSFKNNIEYNVVIKAKSSNNKISSANARIKFKKTDDAKGMCDLYKSLNNKKIDISCYENEIIIKRYQNLELESDKTFISRDDFIKKLKKQGFKC